VQPLNSGKGKTLAAALLKKPNQPNEKANPKSKPSVTPAWRHTLKSLYKVPGS